MAEFVPALAMNRAWRATNSKQAPSQGPVSRVYSVDMTTLDLPYERSPGTASQGAVARWRTIAILTAVVWGAMVALSVLGSLHAIQAQDLAVGLIWRPITADVFGAVLSATTAFGLAGLRRYSILARAVTAVAASLAASVIFSFVSIGLIEPLAGPSFLQAGFGARLIRMASLHVWVFAAYAGFFLLLDQEEPRNMGGASAAAAETLRLGSQEGYPGLDARWFWTFQTAFWSALALFSIANSINLGDSPTQAWRILLAEAGGFAVTGLAHYTLLRPSRLWSLGRRAALALTVSVATTAAYVLGIFVSYFIIAPVEGPPSLATGEITRLEFLLMSAPRWMFLNFPVFVGWSGFYLALDSARRLRAQEKRLYESMMLAKDAQVKMLRFQLNPHFLFNTLNAVSSLLLDKRTEDADAMLGRLARFLRFALEVLPDDETTLEDEIAAQRLYLEIEQIRFEERLQIEFDVEAGCLPALVPTLILQPLLENAVKYGVSRSTRPVHVRVCARRIDANRLELCVTDDGGGIAHPVSSGGGVGLANVAARLRTIYGAEGMLDSGPMEGGGFIARIVLPFVTVSEAAES
ncbi:sensor histidine kinase [Marinicauda sp. Alg238-R41]|uniref:sensor histidine kinase n=1 Tax=Marinicauda sp. Alg238-R41 TaxID=2993447 RepID=UPI0022DF3111|nr:histidine kinase [Marinicauda sp. Alg238-R41]